MSRLRTIRTLDDLQRLRNRGRVWASSCINGNAMLVLNAARPCRCAIFSWVGSCPQSSELCSRAARPGLIGVKDSQRVLQHHNSHRSAERNFKTAESKSVLRASTRVAHPVKSSKELHHCSQGAGRPIRGHSAEEVGKVICIAELRRSRRRGDLWHMLQSCDARCRHTRT